MCGWFYDDERVKWKHLPFELCTPGHKEVRRYEARDQAKEQAHVERREQG